LKYQPFRRWHQISALHISVIIYFTAQVSDSLSRRQSLENQIPWSPLIVIPASSRHSSRQSTLPGNRLNGCPTASNRNKQTPIALTGRKIIMTTITKSEGETDQLKFAPLATAANVAMTESEAPATSRHYDNETLLALAGDD